MSDDASSPDVVAAADGFKKAAHNGTVATFPRATTVGQVTGAELSWVYTNRFARSKSPGRVVYDQIMAAAVNGRCPMCGHRQVASLDHYLAKALFPALSVAPTNLVPTCSDCNKRNLDTAPESPREVLLHPYFDDVESEPWLVAAVRQTAPPSVEFSVAAPVAWPSVLAERVMHQFESLHLATLYASQAADELTNIRHALTMVFNAGGAAEVAAHLTHEADSRTTGTVEAVVGGPCQPAELAPAESGTTDEGTRSPQWTAGPPGTIPTRGARGHCRGAGFPPAARKALPAQRLRAGLVESAGTQLAHSGTRSGDARPSRPTGWGFRHVGVGADRHLGPVPPFT